jgi:peptidoglycan/xylan/chitin deacetylase (PgdA/CDA1 family)
MQLRKGYFVISLDLELYWGMFDKTSLQEYGDRILGERTAIPRMLDLFTKHHIHATWATVGMLMARTRQELVSLLPPLHLRPTYADMRVSAYTHIETEHIGENETVDPYHFGESLVHRIQETPHQEIGNHTFSHYYCIDGYENNINVFIEDLETHRKIAETYGISTESIVFPRNQTNIETLSACNEHGLRAYRGNEEHIFYAPRQESAQSLPIRGMRLLDHYLNISGHHTYQLPHKNPHTPLNIPSSRFLRPWSRKLSIFEWLRLRRIKNSMTHAAKHGEVFHLWWHPHNFGIDQEENFRNLENILQHFEHLRETYGFESASMKDITKLVLPE